VNVHVLKYYLPRIEERKIYGKKVVSSSDFLSMTVQDINVLHAVVME
jgi:hypothetical protein